ncbi:MAG TPA: baseplate J/gp47 family protein [Gemmatimonadaceae bacterium]
MTTIVNQQALADRARLLLARGLNGFDFVLVTLTPAVNPIAAQLEVHFQNADFLPAIVAAIAGTPSLALTIFPITGGHRLRAGSMAGQVQVTGVVAGPGANVLTLAVAPIGDYSTYTLGLQFANVDPVFSELDFKFRPGCFSIDCAPDWKPGTKREPEPAIDYLARDYDSFRHLLMSAMGQRVPGWRPTSEADFDQTLIDLFAVAGDELSDYQDRVMNEAYFASARKRVSIARHARLMDYHIHQGNQASTWLALSLAPAKSGTLPGGLTVWTGPKPRISTSQVFQAHSPQFVHTLLNRFGLYTWSDAIPALAAGSTSADLRIDSGTAFDANLVRGFFQAGLVTHLVIQEWLNPATGNPAGRDPLKRQLLELLPGVPAAETLQDPVTGDFLVRVHWREQDKLTANYCFVVNCSGGPVRDVSLFHGNLVVVDHGTPGEAIFLEPGDPLTLPIQLHFARSSDADVPFSATCAIPDTPLAYTNTLPGGEIPPMSTLKVLVTPPGGATETWVERPDLVHADDGADTGKSFIVETDELRRSVIRFGNGMNGRALPVDAVVHCTYQFGDGLAGNVGADTIVQLDDTLDPLVALATCWNPFDVTSGRAPEPVAQILRRVPEAYRYRQLRAVTLADYVKRAEELPGVSRAAARYAWTGSWRTVQVTIDPVGTIELDPVLRQRIADYLEAVRLIGEDIEIRPPRFVPLIIHVTVCANEAYWPEDLKFVLDQEFSASYTPDGRQAFFNPDAWTFGQELHASEILGRIQEVEGVEHVVSIDIARWDEPSVTVEAVVTLRPNEIILVENDPDHMELGSIDFLVIGGRQ